MEERVKELERLLRDSQDEVKRMDQESRKLKKSLGAHRTIRLWEDIQEEEHEARVGDERLT
ncbi:hypothetical protein E1B28_010832 [Marasmius oreades]|uniref:Uncharacterized protein n=1 Tax=Marasmius oreades TaxID=181124 RepID=A0A9P7RSU8_9AGAR|nr:uncharacterized protein E1B28_010832 [Marasmius oreades]KAG7089124.1 hypothetical protein E1B28_010832 [Marasmius oreades]